MKMLICSCWALFIVALLLSWPSAASRSLPGRYTYVVDTVKIKKNTNADVKAALVKWREKKAWHLVISVTPTNDGIVIMSIDERP